MSDEDDWEFAGPDDAKAEIRAAIQYLLRDATGGARARISHRDERIGAENQRKLFFENDFSMLRRKPRCRQSVWRRDQLSKWNGTILRVIEIMTEELDRTFWRTLRRKSNASYPRRRSSSAPGNQPVITEQELYSL
jgi:hypothetical protein